MTIKLETYDQLKQCCSKYVARTGYDGDPEDLLQEAALIIMQGHRGIKEEGDKYYAAQMAAERISRGMIEKVESTGHEVDFLAGDSPTGRRNRSSDFTEEVDNQDWIETKLDKEQQAIVHCLLEGWTHGDVAHEMAVDRSTATRKIQKIQEIAKGTYDVN